MRSELIILEPRDECFVMEVPELTAFDSGFQRITKISLPMKCALLLCVWLQALALAAMATSYGSQLIRCVHCGESYVVGVLLSWNYTMSGGKGPPETREVCPHCLYGWRGEQVALSPETRSRVHTALSHFSDTIPAPTRQRLRSGLGTFRSDNKEAVLDYLIDTCDRAVTGSERAPKLPVFAPRRSEWNAEEKREFRKLLPTMIAELRSGSLRTLPQGMGDREMGALFSSGDFIAQGDARAAEFAVLWLQAVDRKRAVRCDHAISGNLASLAGLPREKWPAFDRERFRVLLLRDCLEYVRDGGAAPKALRAALASRSWDELTSIVAACCTIRRDVSVRELFSNRLRRPSYADAVAVADYFSAVGTSADLPLLEQEVVGLKPPKDESFSLEFFSREKLEGAMRTIRLRGLLVQ